MKHYLSFFFFFISLIISSSLSAQNTEKEKRLYISKNIIEKESDSVLNNIFSKIFYKNEQTQWGNAVSIANEAINVFKKKKNYNLVADWHSKLGFLYQKHDIYMLALAVYNSGLKYTKNLPEKRAQYYNDIARIYLALNFDLFHTEEYFLKSLNIQKNIKNEFTRKKLQAYSFNQLGIVYERKGKFSEAKQYYLKSLSLRKQLNDSSGLSNSYYTLGFYYKQIGKNDSALYYLNKGLKIAQQPDLRISYYLKLASIYGITKNYEQALSNIEKAYEIAQDKYPMSLAKQRFLKQKPRFPITCRKQKKLLSMPNKL